MRAPDRRRAIVIGGSLGGLFTAAALRSIGWDVTVFEQSPNQLDSRGGGIVLQPDVLAAFRFAGIKPPERLGVDSEDRVYLDRDGRVLEQFHMPQTQTSWNLLYTTLKDALPPESIRSGDAFTSHIVDDEQVIARFSSGHTESADLLIAADGPSSTVRKNVLPEVAPAYAGYVAWRGLVPEPELPEAAAHQLRERFTFQQSPGHSALAYLVPGEDGSTNAGERRFNWVWYRKVAPDALKRLLLDRNGRHRTHSLPPGTVKDSDLHDLRTASDDLMAPVFRSLIDETSEPFLQIIQDLQVRNMVFGRVILLGDAAFIARPHTAGGTAKAAGNALSLAVSLAAAHESRERIDRALARWEADQLQRGIRMNDLGVSLGNRIMNIVR
jgi:2-polyprenyl-6-methoxyphenol hydroxylase-like FAD-dependent oxidoreductase